MAPVVRRNSNVDAVHHAYDEKLTLLMQTMRSNEYSFRTAGPHSLSHCVNMSPPLDATDTRTHEPRASAHRPPANALRKKESADTEHFGLSPSPPSSPRPSPSSFLYRNLLALTPPPADTFAPAYAHTPVTYRPPVSYPTGLAAAMDHQVAYLPVAYKIFVLGVTLMLLAWTILTWCVNFPPRTWHWRWHWRWWWWCRHPQSHLPSSPLADRHRGSSKRNDDHHPDPDKSPAKPHKTRKKQTKHAEGPRRWLAPKPGSWLLEWASGKWHRDEGKPIDKPGKYASPPGRPTTSMATTTTNSRGGGEPENDAGLANGNAPEWVTISLAGAKGQWDEEEYFHHNHHDHNQHYRKDDDDDDDDNDDDEGVRTRDSNVRDDAAVLPDAWPLPVPASRPRSPAPPPAAAMSAAGSSRTQAIATGFHTPGPGSAIRHLARQTPARPPSPENPYIPPVSMRPRTSEEWVLDREAFFSPKAAPPRAPSPAPSTLAPTPTPAQGQAPVPAPDPYARSSRHSQAAQSLFVGSTAENPLTFIARPYDAYTYDVEALDATSSSHRSASAATGSRNNLAPALAAGSQHRREHSAGSWLDLVDDAVTWGAAKFAEFTDDDGDDTELLPISNPMMKGKSD